VQYCVQRCKVESREESCIYRSASLHATGAEHANTMKTAYWVATMDTCLAISLHVMRHLSNSSPCACHDIKVGHHLLLAAASVHSAKPEQGLCILFLPHQSCQSVVGYLVHPLWWCSRNLHLSQSWSMLSNDCACLVDVLHVYVHYMCNPTLFSTQLPSQIERFALLKALYSARQAMGRLSLHLTAHTT